MLEVTQVEGNQNVCAATMIVYSSVLGPQVLLVQRRAVPRLSLKLHIRYKKTNLRKLHQLICLK